MGALDEASQAKVVNLMTRNERGHVVHSTASVYSPESSRMMITTDETDGQVTELREALNDKELELMELRELHMQLQSSTSEAQGNWEAALESKDRAIQQLEDALSLKEKTLNAMALRKKQWEESQGKTAADQQEHEHRMQLLQAQVADANATMALLRAQIERQGSSRYLSASHTGPGEHGPLASRNSLPRTSHPLLNMPARADDLMSSKVSNTVPGKLLHQPTGHNGQAHIAVVSWEPKADGIEQDLSNHLQDSTDSVRLKRACGPHNGSMRRDAIDRHDVSEDRVPRLSSQSEPLIAEHGKEFASWTGQVQAAPAEQCPELLGTWQDAAAQGGPGTEPMTSQDSAPAVAALSGMRRGIYSASDCQMQHNSGMRTCAGFPKSAQAWLSAASMQHVPQKGHVPAENMDLVENLKKTQQLLAEFSTRPLLDGDSIQSRVVHLLRDQERLIRSVAADVGVSDAVPDNGYSHSSRDWAHDDLLEARLQSAQAKAEFLSARNATLEEEKQGLELDRAAMQQAMQDRDAALQDVQRRADSLRARLHDLEGALPSDKQHSAQQSLLEDLTEQVNRLQRKLTTRDAAAKKYKDGCRALKAQVEHLEEAGNELRKEKAELEWRLTRAASDGGEASERHQRELQSLLSEAQEEVATSRSIALKAERRKKELIEQVRDLRLEAERLEMAKRSAEQQASRLLDEERLRLQRALQQRTADLDAKSASYQEELLTAVQRAEHLRQAMAETEANMIRKISCAEEATKAAECRAADASAELTRLRQRLATVEETAARDARQLDASERELKAEQQHSFALQERLDRASARAQSLEQQITDAAEQVGAARDEKRALDASAAELSFKLSRTERVASEEACAAKQAEERAGVLLQRLRAAEAAAVQHHEQTAAQSQAAKEWEVRLMEADEAVLAADSNAKTLEQRLSDAEAEKQSLRETLIQTEALIRRARQEHSDEIAATRRDTAQKVEDMQTSIKEQQRVAEREQIARERAEQCLQEAHQALERHSTSMEASRAKGIQATQTIQQLKIRLQTLQAGLEEKNEAVAGLQIQLHGLHKQHAASLAEKDKQLQAQQEEFAGVMSDKDKQLEAAQARLAQVAPIMRRIAARARA